MKSIPITFSAGIYEFYKVICIQPVDVFPHTHHVENVVLLEKREE